MRNDRLDDAQSSKFIETKALDLNEIEELNLELKYGETIVYGDGHEYCSSRGFYKKDEAPADLEKRQGTLIEFCLKDTGEHYVVIHESDEQATAAINRINEDQSVILIGTKSLSQVEAVRKPTPTSPQTTLFKDANPASASTESAQEYKTIGIGKAQ